MDPVSVLDYRYGTEEMRNIFRANSYLNFLLKVEATLAEAQSEIGIIPKEAAAEIKKGLPLVKRHRVEEIESNTIVLVEALPNEIENRRSKDDSRNRDSDDIGLHQRINREYAIAAAFMTGATVGFVPNNDDKIDLAVEEFKKILEK